MGVTCDPGDEPSRFNLLPDFGDRGGTLYYCGPYDRATWPPSFVLSACTLVATAQCRRVVMLGDVSAEQPDISLVTLPPPDLWWMRVPFVHRAGLRLRFRRTRPGHHVAVLATAGGEETVIGAELARREHSSVPRTGAGVARLLAQARRMAVRKGAAQQARA
jgi:hypothetical protein